MRETTKMRKSKQHTKKKLRRYRIWISFDSSLRISPIRCKSLWIFLLLLHGANVHVVEYMRKHEMILIRLIFNCRVESNVELNRRGILMMRHGFRYDDVDETLKNWKTIMEIMTSLTLSTSYTHFFNLQRFQFTVERHLISSQVKFFAQISSIFD